jgi:Ca-activated chloride channel family protein
VRDFGMNRLMYFGRGAALLLTLVALLLPGPADLPTAAGLAVLVDRSDANSPASQAAAQETLRRDLAPVANKLAITIIEYGNAGHPAAASDVLRHALRQFDPRSRNSIVVVSDGHWPGQTTTLLEQAADAGIAMYWLRPEAEGVRPRIEQLIAPSRARPGQRVHVQIETTLPDAGNFAVELHSDEGVLGRQEVGADGFARIPVTIQASGTVLLDAVLFDDDSGLVVDRLQPGASINVLSSPSLLVITNDRSPLAASLVAGGWAVTLIRPDEYAAIGKPVANFGAVILDDIAATDMSDAAWLDLTNAVRRHAVGLLVLGGPNSFGVGAYRGSILEQVLPVVSEPPDNEKPATVMFLVDISGSMGQQSGGHTTLPVAQEAVLFAAASLQATDRVGLITFDVEARLLLAPQPRDDHVSTIRSQWPGRASGGTSVVPALELARGVLAAERTDQKIVLLVTDGNLATDDIPQLQAWLDATNVEFTALVLSDDGGDVPLARLPLNEKASILAVDEVMRLPVLMRDALESLRAPVHTETSVPAVVSPLPMADFPGNTPPLESYVVTRARPEAVVMLTGERGEPLAATWVAGTGRVLTLAGGLNQWAVEWMRWDRWPDLVAGLINHIAVTEPASATHRMEYDAQGNVSLVIDTGAIATTQDSLRVRLIPPAGAVEEVALVPDAPGRYRATVPSSLEGQFTLTWEDEDGIHRHSSVRRDDRTRVSTESRLAQRLVEDGLLEEWRGDIAANLAPPTSYRWALLALALGLLMVTIAAERVPFQPRGLRFRRRTLKAAR